MKWLKNIFRYKRKEASYQAQFEKNDLDRIFEDLEEIHYKKLRLENYFASLVKKQQDLQKYENFTEENQQKLNEYVNTYKEIEERKQGLKGRLITTNEALNRLVPYEEEIPAYIQEMQVTEKKMKDSENDIYYLEEERDALLEDREVLLEGYGFLQGFSVIFLTTLVVGVFIAFACLQVIREEIWVVLSSVAIVFSAFLVGVLYAKERFEKALKDNSILQQKAAKYINKSNIRYFHQKRYMDHVCEKFAVENTAQLEMHYNRYLKNKNNEQQFIGYNRQLAQLEKNISFILEESGGNLVAFDTLEEWTMIPKRAKWFENTVKEKEKISAQIEMLVNYEKELWQEIYALKEDPKYVLDVEKRVEKYLANTQQYLDKLEQDA